MQCRTLRHKPFSANSDHWFLKLDGQVEKPLNLSMDSFYDLSAVAMPIAITCIGSSARHPLIRQAVWKGVPLQDLLTEAQVNPAAAYAQFIAADGYTTYLPTALLAEALLAYSMDGQDLRPEQGYPLRLIVPGVYGFKMPKWIQHIELTQTPMPGYWEAQGWSVSGQVQTVSHIFSPHHMQTISGLVQLTGVAYAGQRMITQVEVSIDDADWMPVAFTSATPGSWTRWQAEWQPPAWGDYTIRVRATDSDGFTQPEIPPTAAFPKGSNAIHSIVIRFTPSLEVAYS
jgi:Oxidoreductase molybdopterin binding domain